MYCIDLTLFEICIVIYKFTKFGSIVLVMAFFHWQVQCQTSVYLSCSTKSFNQIKIFTQYNVIVYMYTIRYTVVPFTRY